MAEYNIKIPRVSVTVVTYNHGEMLKECINSILSQKTDFPFEVIVADDASDDLISRNILQDFCKKNISNLRIISNSFNIGPIPNLFKVVAATRGEFIAHIDGDDYMLPGKLQAQFNVLNNHADCAVVFHKLADSNSISPFSNDLNIIIYESEEWLKRGCFLPHSSKMYRAENIITKFEIEPIVDFGLHLEHSKNGKIYFIDAFLGVKRFHPDMITKSNFWRPYIQKAHENAYDRAVMLGYRKEIAMYGKIKFRQGLGLSLIKTKKYYESIEYLKIPKPLHVYATKEQLLLSSLADYPLLISILQRIRHYFK